MAMAPGKIKSSTITFLSIKIEAEAQKKVQFTIITDRYT
jgi:hypothetical protein